MVSNIMAVLRCRIYVWTTESAKIYAGDTNYDKLKNVSVKNED